ncbi:MAG: NUDIX hydrolase [Pseudomonadota bacterium]
MSARSKPPRLAVRAVLVEQGRVLLVNAWPGHGSDLWCAPGGGVEPGDSLPSNLRREMYEETGLTVEVGQPCLVNEFHDPERGFHQVEVFFRCVRLEGEAPLDTRDWPGRARHVSDGRAAHAPERAARGAQDAPVWQDPEGVVNRWMWADEQDLRTLRVKPDALSRVALGDGLLAYDPLERIQR